MINFYLSLSDSAKLANTAKNFLQTNQLVTGHNFFDINRLSSYQHDNFLPADLPYFPVWVLSQFFKFLQPTDLTVAFAGLLFLLLGTLLVYLIGRKLASRRVALVAVFLTLTNQQLILYALNFSTEILFTFELLLFVYVMLRPNKINILTGGLTLVLMLITRQQAFLIVAVIASLGTWKIITTGQLTFTSKLTIFLTSGILLFIFLYYSHSNSNDVLSPARLLGAIHLPTDQAPGEFIRGQTIGTLSLKTISVKIFYNLYNFLKQPDRIANPILIWLFAVGLFLRTSDKGVVFFKTFTLGCLLLFLLAASATLPNARYLHPLTPLLAIGAAISLENILLAVKSKTNASALMIVTLLMVSIPTVGYWTLDLRYRQQKYHLDKPPARRLLAAETARLTQKGRLVITNLDAWGAWYEDLTTVWFPNNPQMLVSIDDKVDYIMISDYQADDADFALGKWAELLENPDSVTQSGLSRGFKFVERFEIKASEVYENQDYHGVVFARK